MQYVRNYVRSEGWEKLPVQWKALAHWVVRKTYPSSHFLWEELDEEAMIALTKAAAYYNPKKLVKGKPVKFNTYAVNVIRRELGRVYGRMYEYIERQRTLNFAHFHRDRQDWDGRLQEETAAIRSSLLVDELLSNRFLTEEERQVVRLHHLEGLTMPQIDSHFGWGKRKANRLHDSAMDIIRKSVGRAV